MTLEGVGTAAVALESTLSLLYLGYEHDVVKHGKMNLIEALKESATRVSGALALNYLRKFLPTPCYGRHRVNSDSTVEASVALHAFAKFFGSDNLSDLTFVIDGRKLPAHRVILSCAVDSDYFAISLSQYLFLDLQGTYFPFHEERLSFLSTFSVRMQERYVLKE